MKKQQKRIALLILLALVSLIFVACNDQTEDDEPDERLEQLSELEANFQILTQELELLQIELDSVKNLLVESAANTFWLLHNAARQNQEFVYKGDLEIDGKLVREMTREEIESYPPIRSTIEINGKEVEIPLPEEVTNLYEQLKYNDHIQSQTFVSQSPFGLFATEADKARSIEKEEAEEPVSTHAEPTDPESEAESVEDTDNEEATKGN